MPGNWGRWGAHDERGALNHLTGEHVVAASGLVREGRVVPLGLPVDSRVPRLPGRPPVQHLMTIDGADYEAGTRPVNGRCVSDDALMLSAHGTTTHVDALSHVWSEGALYNGFPQRSVRSRGATRCGIDKTAAVVTRGLLLDVPALLGVSHLDVDHEIEAEELEAAAGRAGLEVRAGDAVLVRTGWPAAELAGRDAGRQAGLAGSACRWLAGHDVTLVGADNYAIGPLLDHGGFHVAPEDDAHLVLLWSHGVLLLEMLDLEELAALGATEFLFVLAPLRITGGTASPVNPLAVL